MRCAIHHSAMLQSHALFHMFGDDNSMVLQGDSETVNGSSNMGGPAGLKISGFMLILVFFGKWELINNDLTSLTSVPVVNIISAEIKLLVIMLFLKRHEILTSVKLQGFSPLIHKVKISLKGWELFRGFCFFVNFDGIFKIRIFPLKLCTTVLNKVLLVALEALYICQAAAGLVSADKVCACVCWGHGCVSQNSEICLSCPNSSVTLQDRPQFEHPLLVSSEKYDCLFLNEEAQVLFHCIKMKPNQP